MVNSLAFILKMKWRFRRWNEEKIKKYQNKHVKDLVRFAVDNSSFYATYYKEYDTTNFTSLPFMNKNLFMDNFSDLNTKGLTKEECLEHCMVKERTRDFSQYYKGYLVGLSTGTSGSRGLEFVTKKEALLMKLMVILRFPFPRALRYHLGFILRVFSPGFDYKGLRIRVSYINPLKSKEKMIERLNELRPNIISAPPSILQVLAKAKTDNKLHLNPILVVSYAEVLSIEVKQKLKETFNVPVLEVYKSSESFLALPCNKGNLHLNEDVAYVELLDTNNKPVKPGNPGFVVVTDLLKKGTPLIRYKMNDLLTISPEKCSCGSNFRVIQQIHGRADDIIVGVNVETSKYEMILPDFFRRAVVRSSDNIKEYNVIQHSLDEMEIRLEFNEETGELELDNCKEDLEKNIIQNIEDILLKHDCKMPKVGFVYGKIQQDPDKKLRRVRSTISKDYFT